MIKAVHFYTVTRFSEVKTRVKPELQHTAEFNTSVGCGKQNNHSNASKMPGFYFAVYYDIKYQILTKYDIIIICSVIY